MFKKIFNKKEVLPTDLNRKLTTSLFIIVSLGIITSMVMFVIANNNLKSKIIDTEEANRPAELEITIIEDKSCTSCFNMDSLVETITKENVKVISANKIDSSSVEGVDLINKYSIKSIPSAIISGELSKNDTVSKFLAQIGEIQDGTFIMRNSIPPYVDVVTGEIMGEVKLTMITDRNCQECYDVTVHEGILRSLGLASFKSEVFDINFDDGKKLIDKYNINLLPAIILTGQVDYYPSLKKIWENVGTVELDGSYVFREGVKQMGVYKNLALDTVIKPEVKKTQ